MAANPARRAMHKTASKAANVEPQHEAKQASRELHFHPFERFI